MSLRILLLSAYDAESHRRWRLQLTQQLSQHQWTVLTLPPRHFRWRIRGNPLSWALSSAETLQQPFDRIFATSMVELATLKGIFPSLAQTPSILYFHENQFAYPNQPEYIPQDLIHLQLHHIYSALSANTIAFNSNYNRDTFFAGVQKCLKPMPEKLPLQSLLGIFQSRTKVLPVPLEAHCFAIRNAPIQGPLTILWNHRWEHDKAPERFFGAIELLEQWGVPYKLHVVGQQFRQIPPIFEKARAQFAQNIGYWGYLEDVQSYRDLLRQCDIVVSTALHDFQGLSVLEAVAAGCHPLVPDRLAYPQWFPEDNRYPSTPEDTQTEVHVLARRLQTLAHRLPHIRQLPPPTLEHLSWQNLRMEYEELLASCQYSTKPLFPTEESNGENDNLTGQGFVCQHRSEETLE